MTKPLAAVLDLDSGGFETGLKKAEKSAKKAGKTIRRSFGAAVENARFNTARYIGALKDATLAIGAFGIAAVTVAAVKVAAMANEAITAAESFDKMSQRVGISVSELSTLKFAAEQSGSSITGLETGMRRFSRSIEESVSGVGEGGKALVSLGINVRDANGNIRETREILDDVADKFSQYGDDAMKASLAQEIFGRSGTELIPLLNSGKSGIAGMQEQAHKLGATIKNDTAKQAAAFKDKLNALKTAFESIGRAVSVKVLPSLNEILDAMVEQAEQGSILETALAGVNEAWIQLKATASGKDPMAVRLEDINEQIDKTLRSMNAIRQGRFTGSGGGFFSGEDQKAADEEFARLKEHLKRLRDLRDVNEPGFSEAGLDEANPEGADAFGGEAERPSIGTLVASQEKLDADLERAREHRTKLAEEEALWMEERAAFLASEDAKREAKQKRADEEAEKRERERGLRKVKVAEAVSRGIQSIARAAGIQSHGASKAFAIADAGIQFARAKARAVAEGGPFAGPAAIGAVASLFAGIMGALKSSKPPAFAGGGFAPGGPALVGERGTELVNLPRGARVSNASTTQDQLGASIDLSGSTFSFGGEPGRSFGEAEAQMIGAVLTEALRLNQVPELVTELGTQLGVT